MGFNFNRRKKGHGRPPFCCGPRRGEIELLGLILIIIGAVSICVLLLPPTLWLIMIGAVMVALGCKLFIS